MKRAAVIALLACVLTILAAAPSRAADPFYVGLLESGTQDYLRGDYQEAAKSLRIASFGFLDEPPLLTRGLIRLALAQAGAGDEDGFDATFERLVEVESAFGTYSDLPPETPFKADFERALSTRVEPENLARVPAFATVLDSIRQAKLTALPPKRLRRQLKRRIEADPEDAEALVLLTRLEISESQSRKAAARLAELIEENPENRIARCLRGQMRLREGKCPAAMEDLDYCSAPPTDEVLGASYLRCLIEASDWMSAARQVSALPLEVRSRQEVSSLILEIPPQALEQVAELTVGTEEAPAEASTASGERPLDPGDRDRTSELLLRLREATTRQQLAGILEEARELAERYRDDRQLQFLCAQAAYRLGDWPEAIRFFRRGGMPGSDRPLLRFYLAVAYYENGERQEAAEALAGALPALEPTPFVERYRRLILGPAESPKNDGE